MTFFSNLKIYTFRIVFELRIYDGYIEVDSVQRAFVIV